MRNPLYNREADASNVPGFQSLDLHKILHVPQAAVRTDLCLLASWGGPLKMYPENLVSTVCLHQTWQP